MPMPEYLNNEARRSFLSRASSYFLHGKDAPQLVLITHILPDRPPFIEALSEALDIALIIAIPYSCDQAVFGLLETQFPMIHVELSTLLDADRLTSIISDHVSRDFIVLEIGGYFAGASKNFLSNDRPRAMGIVEGTESGVRRYQAGDGPELPVIAMPNSSIKDAESRLIGETCVFSFEKILRQVGLTQAPKTFFINGYGRIGESVAAACRKRGYDVLVYDVDDERRIQAIAGGFRTPDRSACLTECDVVFGCAGQRSFFLEDADIIRGQTFLVSATSKDVEFCFSDLSREIKFQSISSHLSIGQAAAAELYMIHDGHPVNFVDGADVGFLLTLLQAEMIASVGSILEARVPPGVHPPNKAKRQQLCGMWFDTFVEPSRGWYRMAN